MAHDPTAETIATLAEDLGMSVTPAEAEDYAHLIETTLADYDEIRKMAEPAAPPEEKRYARSDSGRRPTEDEDPYNAWISRTEVIGADEGVLSDARVGLKDNIALAGVEMTCGSTFLKGYVPSITATVVHRLLDEGATIVGKNNMDSFGFSSSGDLSDFGAVRNPADKAYLAGGSSSGCAAALAADEIDIALGCDQGGSICVPAANCGVVGLRPTTGLVPYTGIFPIERTIDHVGPMAQRVADVAVTLDVIAGRDGLDARQPSDLRTESYTEALGKDVSGMTVALLEEGFDHPESKAAVTDAVDSAVELLESLGVEVKRLSVPIHNRAPAVAWLIWGYGSLHVFKQAGQVPQHDGWYDTDLKRIFSKCRAAVDTLPPMVKATLLAMEYIDQRHNALYGKAKNIGQSITRRYDDALEEVDAFILPTTPGKPLGVNPELDRIERIIRTFPPNKNTCPFAVTGHPTLTVPCGTVDGLPIGMMLVGSQFDESTILSIADAYERHSS
ncbi:amidase [Haloarcula nitratireducens]|uniref:Amidase n=1 Tax=Haloarcula nitratireducens TaxID=2487749 RepID=A0AAW4PIU9_9EURY|nr:amidase [Halomicroarcula nitratireducens]MBX0297215.1 amidase [Halomicroarcula nitratireducens]